MKHGGTTAGGNTGRSGEDQRRSPHRTGRAGARNFGLASRRCGEQKEHASRGRATSRWRRQCEAAAHGGAARNQGREAVEGGGQSAGRRRQSQRRGGSRWRPTRGERSRRQPERGRKEAAASAGKYEAAARKKVGSRGLPAGKKVGRSWVRTAAPTRGRRRGGFG